MREVVGEVMGSKRGKKYRMFLFLFSQASDDEVVWYGADIIGLPPQWWLWVGWSGARERQGEITAKCLLDELSKLGWCAPHVRPCPVLVTARLS